VPGSEHSHTFHGRDVYVFTGARLAAGVIAFADVGPERDRDVVRLAYEKARRDGDALVGTIPALDVRYGNVWTSIPESLFARLEPKLGEVFRVTITHQGREVFRGAVPYVTTFGEVPEGEPLLYVNSLLDLALALNQASFAAAHGIAAGGDWSVRIER
jgi:S-adenosylmethionine hydrolase